MDFDSHAAVKRLAQTGLTEAQAEALVEALRALARSQREDLATRKDLDHAVAELRNEIKHLATKAELGAVENHLIRWMIGIGFAIVAINTAVVALFV